MPSDYDHAGAGLQMSAVAPWRAGDLGGLHAKVMANTLVPPHFIHHLTFVGEIVLLP